MLMKSKIKRLL